MVLKDVKKFFCRELELIEEKNNSIRDNHFVIASEMTSL